MIGIQPFADLAGGIRTIACFNFDPEAMRAPQRSSGSPALQDDGRNLARAIEGMKEIDEDALARVKMFLRAFVPEIDGFEVVQLGDYETIRFRMCIDGSRRFLDLDASSMSDGTLRALAALVAAFQIVLPHGYPGLVAIEEPETALHPAAMRALVDALDEATTHTHVVLTTHSADLLDNPTIGPGNIRMVQLIDGQTVIAPVDAGSVDIIGRRLNTLGGLERDSLLDRISMIWSVRSTLPKLGRSRPDDLLHRSDRRRANREYVCRTTAYRVWTEILACSVRLQVLLPSRASRDKLVNPAGAELANKVEEAFAKLSQRLCRDPQARGLLLLLLLLLDAERDCPKELAPKLLAKARQARSDVDVVCVLAKRMFENWIVAGASTLAGINGLPAELGARDQFEERSGVAWLEGQLRLRNPRRKYKKTVDAEPFIKAMNLSECRANCPSFAKLCKEPRVQQIAAAAEPGGTPPAGGGALEPPE